MSWIYKAIMDLLVDALSDVVEFVSNNVAGLFSLENTMKAIDATNGAVKAVTALALVLAVILSARQLLSTYVLETEDAGEEPVDFLFRLACCCAAIGTFGAVGKELIHWAGVLAGDVVNATDIAFPEEYFHSIINGGTSLTLVVVLLLLFFVIGSIVFYIIAAIRAGTLAVYHLAAPLFCLDLLTTGKELWRNFITAYLSTVFFYIIQLFCFTQSQKILIGSIQNSGNTILIAIAFLILAISAPSALERLVFRSGVKSGISGLARTAGSLAVMIRK